VEKKLVIQNFVQEVVPPLLLIRFRQNGKSRESVLDVIALLGIIVLNYVRNIFRNINQQPLKKLEKELWANTDLKTA
jgi:hypothetical protein